MQHYFISGVPGIVRQQPTMPLSNTFKQKTANFNKMDPLSSYANGYLNFMHYYSSGKKNNLLFHLYYPDNPRWKVNKVIGSCIPCNLKSMFGKNFISISNHNPYNINPAEGSLVTGRQSI